MERPWDTRSVGGGTWHYGSTVLTGWSNYLHPTKCHGSSVESGHNYDQDFGVRAGNWSDASIWRDGTIKVKTYWRNTC